MQILNVSNVNWILVHRGFMKPYNVVYLCDSKPQLKKKVLNDGIA